MSTTHPTNITTEWDDLQRKYGNLPKLKKEETNEVKDARLVEVSELELLREARLRAWKKSMEAKVQPTFGVPVPITEDNFVTEVTNASRAISKAQDDGEDECDGYGGEYSENKGKKALKAQPDLLETAGQYIPVLLLDDRREAGYLRDAWNELARRHPTIKFTVGAANKVLRAENTNSTAPSSILLYFGGKCVMQSVAYTVLRSTTYELAGESLESRIANAIEVLLNSASKHGPFLSGSKTRASSDSDSDSDSENEDRRALRSAGQSFRKDFLSKFSGGKFRRNSDSGSESDRETNSKTYISWVLDKALT